MGPPVALTLVAVVLNGRLVPVVLVTVNEVLVPAVKDPNEIPVFEVIFAKHPLPLPYVGQ
jgi:hypothetical protein